MNPLPPSLSWACALLVATLGVVAPGCGASEEPLVCEECAVGASPLRRLTRDEYLDTLRDLVGAEVIELVEESLWRVPDERSPRGFQTMSRDMGVDHVDGWFRIAEAVAEVVAESPEKLQGVPACALAATFDEPCVQETVRTLGGLAFRRPLRSEEAEELGAMMTGGAALGSAEGLATLVFALLQAPQFLYRVEDGGAELEAGLFQLTSWEQAARLSYALTGSMPDAPLRALAAAHDRLTPDQLLEEALRLAGDPLRAQAWSFYSQWLRLPYIPYIRQGAPLIDPTKAVGLRDAMIEDVRRFVMHHTFERDGTYTDLMVATDVYPGTANLALVYEYPGTIGPDSSGDITDGTRDGLLTRPAILLGGATQTSAPKRGAFIRVHLLCDPIPPPTIVAGAVEDFAEPDEDIDMTGRQRWEQHTGKPECAGCHKRFNPLGFALEGYDPIGRVRTEEYTTNLYNDFGKYLPIDDAVEVDLGDGVVLALQGAAQLGAAMAQSEVGPRCMARQWFRFATGRYDRADDEPTIRRLTAALIDPAGGLRHMLVELARTGELQRRSVADVEAASP